MLHLRVKPYFRAAAESLGKPYRHLRRDGGLPVRKVIQSLPRDAKGATASLMVKPMGPNSGNILLNS